jgi:hypothetical protein
MVTTYILEPGEYYYLATINKILYLKENVLYIMN